MNSPESKNFPHRPKRADLSLLFRSGHNKPIRLAVMLLTIVFLGGFWPESPVLAGELPAPESRKLDSEAEVGIVNTTGNAETRSINAKFRIENERERWRERFNAEYLKLSDREQTTAEKTGAAAKADYKISERGYVFTSLRYDRDVFSGYNAQIVETAGYGRKFIQTEATDLEGEVGFGGRHTRFIDQQRNRETILRVAAKFIRRLDSAGEFREEAVTETAGDNTRTESVTSLKSMINGKLSMKLAYTVIHNSRVLPGIRKTDTVTSVTLVYDLL